MRFTYYIDDVQVTPMNTRDGKIKDTLEEDLIYAYRNGYNNPITLQDTDYDYIKTIEATAIHEKHTFLIDDSVLLKQLTFEFTIYDCEFDDYIRQVTIKITPRDAYTAIQENEDIEVNLLAEERTNITGEVYSRWLFYGKLKDSTGVAEDETYGKNLGIVVPLTLIGPQLSAVIFATEVVTIHKSETAPVGWNLMTDLDEFKIYQRLPVNFPTLDTEAWELSPLGMGIYNWPVGADYQWSGYNRLQYVLGYKYRDPLLNDTENDYNYFRLDFSNENAYVGTSNLNDFWLKKSLYNHRANVVFTRTYKSVGLRDSIDRILTGIGTSYTFKSSLLLSDEAESGKALPSGYPAVENGLYLIALSDFKRPTASQQAIKAITTLKRAFDYLCGKFKSFWTIDADGCIRIDNVTYFEPTQSLDISSDPLLNLKYSYLTDDKPNREYLSESVSYNEDFKQTETLYGTVPAVNGTKENTKSTSLSDFYTDVDGLNAHLEELPDEGFVLVEVLSGAIVKATGFKSGDTSLQNANLSNANVLNTFHRYNAYQPDYYIAGKPVTALSLRRMKKQELEHYAVPDKTKLLTTKIGTGKLISTEYDTVEEHVYKSEVHYG